MSEPGLCPCVNGWVTVGRVWAVFRPSGQLYLCNEFCNKQKNPLPRLKFHVFEPDVAHTDDGPYETLVPSA